MESLSCSIKFYVWIHYGNQRVGSNYGSLIPMGNKCGCVVNQELHPPIPMKNQDDIIKGLSSFIGLWESLVERDPSGSYARSHNDLILYWKGVRDALQMLLPPPVASLMNGFWPVTHIQGQDNVPLSNDGTLREEFAEDEPFIGAVGEQPHPSF
jgi:hypothetical protein